MRTLEDKLRDYYSDEPDTRAAEARLRATLATSEPRRAAHRRPAYAAAACALVVAALAVGLITFRQTTTAPNVTSTQASTPSASVTDVPASNIVDTTIGDVSISHPAAWRYVRQAANYGGAPLGYFTTEPTRTQCTPIHDGETCTSPVARLDLHGVFVELSGGGGPLGGSDTTPNGTVAHYPGNITTSRGVPADGCLKGSTDSIMATIQPLADNYRLTVCLNQPTDQQRSAALAMINSFRLQGAAPCPGQCPAHPSKTTVHLTIGTHSYILNPGANHPIDVPAEISTPVTVTIDNATRAPVTNVYLFLTAGENTVYGDRAPTGKIDILARHSGTLKPGAALSTTWTPKTLFGRTKLNLDLQYSIGDQGGDGTIAAITLTN